MVANYLQLAKFSVKLLNKILEQIAVVLHEFRGDFLRENFKDVYVRLFEIGE